MVAGEKGTGHGGRLEHERQNPWALPVRSAISLGAPAARTPRMAAGTRRPSAPKIAAAASAGATQAGKGQPAGFKPLNASRARSRSSRPRFSTPAARAQRLGQ
jgi:hypothetical protein